ncbi:polysaccharide pyruvyl transferase family protein [Agromyces sp. ISL-38]|uniref:polysaccharide pyruvyl transferase family protein n=1 Tax=Agromyces sp. ISL-38 TaxID=2819107 RepID=UPI001BE54E75|nr:polysaccharide pyruvyl transferase family protein [Agromyces sp. ISL-38]MBT2498990.1 polysaccharide pyruvyl transferase family protein [Agromyces sp. ISL-38]
MQKRVLVMWAEEASPNFGVRVLARGLIDGLPRDWELRFASHRSPLESGALSLKRLLLAALIPWHPTRRELASYDLILDVGEGDSFASIYGLKRFGKMIASKMAAGLSRSTLVLCPQTLGPWDAGIATWAARLATRRAVQVWARDSQSTARARKAGIQGLQQATDLVFAVNEPPPLEDEGKSGTTYDLLLNVSGLLWNPNSHVDHLIYRSIIRDVITDASERGLVTGLLVHVSAKGSADDDRAIASLLADEIHALDVIAPDHLDELRGVVSRAGLLVGSRMHACLNAISLGVPAIALAYSDKFRPLFEDLGYDGVIDLRAVESHFRLDLDGAIGSEALRSSAQAARDEGRRRVDRFLTKVGEA